MATKAIRPAVETLLLAVVAILIAGVLVLCPATPAFSTSVVKLVDEDLVYLSSMIVEGTITSVRSDWNAEHDQIHTLVVLKVSRSLKGNTREGAAFTMRLLGGRVGDDVMEVVGGPSFITGEDVIVFIAADGTALFPITGLHQGKFTISTDPSTGQQMIAGRETTRDAFVDKIARLVQAQEEGR